MEFVGIGVFCVKLYALKYVIMIVNVIRGQYEKVFHVEMQCSALHKSLIMFTYSLSCLIGGKIIMLCLYNHHQHFFLLSSPTLVHTFMLAIQNKKMLFLRVMTPFFHNINNAHIISHFNGSLKRRRRFKCFHSTAFTSI